ncbi:hypothetical protein NEUTE2DRAFT_129835 [Neurospora tetrasperma FGSC 2509]|nr:hypothetical protein NEUTE2DRAFT_129835 [Neurospora tetrasperma FGSC 2509]
MHDGLDKSDHWRNARGTGLRLPGLNLLLQTRTLVVSTEPGTGYSRYKCEATLTGILESEPSRLWSLQVGSAGLTGQIIQSVCMHDCRAYLPLTYLQTAPLPNTPALQPKY